MFELTVGLVSVSISLYFWGIIRTAIWLLPSLFFSQAFPILSASWLSFWLTLSFVARYQGGFFDFRDISRQKWIFVYFITGVLTGTLLYPAQIFAFALGSLLPLLFIKIFFLFRYPAGEIMFVRKQIRWVLLALWIICGIVRALELHFTV
jgi:hypothetical protein